jgi:hypothetical protein
MHRSALVVFALCFAACGGSSEKSEIYRVRAQIIELHGSGDDRRVTAAHEAIPDFKDRSGKTSGMEAMTMAFGVAPSVDASALRPGSKWELTVDVQWGREPMLLITAARALPADAQLTLPPAGGG